MVAVVVAGKALPLIKAGFLNPLRWGVGIRTPELARRTLLLGGILAPLNGELLPKLPEAEDDDDDDDDDEDEDEEELPFIWTSPPSFPSPTYNDRCVVVLPVVDFEFGGAAVAVAGPALVLPPRNGKKGVDEGTKASDVHSTTRENAIKEIK
jgi:hypothetical protein